MFGSLATWSCSEEKKVLQSPLYLCLCLEESLVLRLDVVEDWFPATWVVHCVTKARRVHWNVDITVIWFFWFSISSSKVMFHYLLWESSWHQHLPSAALCEFQPEIDKWLVERVLTELKPGQSFSVSNLVPDGPRSKCLSGTCRSCKSKIWADPKLKTSVLMHKIIDYLAYLSCS